MITNIPLEILAIEEDGFHLMITGLVNGKEAKFILDTGASRTVFDENQIIKLLGHGDMQEIDKLSTGLGTSSMESKTVVIEELRLNDITIPHYEAAVLNLQHVNESYEKSELPTIDGVLGGDILMEYSAIIDYEKKMMTLTTSK